MSKKVEHIRKTWRRSRFFCLYIFPFWVLFIAGINIWSDASAGQDFDFTNIWAPVAFLVFDAVLLGFMWLIFKFVLGIASSGSEEL